MTTSDPPPLKGVLPAATSTASEKILFAPTTSHMRHKFTFHQHGQLAHLNTIIVNYMRPQRQEETVADEIESTQDDTVVIVDKDDDAVLPHSDTVNVEMHKTPRNSNDIAREMGEHDAATKQQKELERARQILNEYVEALRLSKSTSLAQKTAAEGGQNVSPSSKPHPPATGVTDANVLPNHPTANDGSNSGSLFGGVESGVEGSVPPSRKRSLPLALRPDATKKPAADSELDV